MLALMEHTPRYVRFNDGVEFISEGEFQILDKWFWELRDHYPVGYKKRENYV